MFTLPALFGIIAGGISTLLAGLIARSYFLNKMKATIILFMVACAVSISQFIFAFLMSLSDGYFLLAQAFYILVVISGIVAVLLIILFFEYIEFGHIRTVIAFVCGILIGPIIIILFLPGEVLPFYDYDFLAWMINLSLYLRILISILGICTLLRLIKGSISIYRHATNKRLKSQFKIAFSGILIAIVGLFVVSAFGILISNFDYTMGSIMRGTFPLVITLGLFIAFIGFNINPYSIYLISQKVFKIIVFNKEGITLFDRELQSSPLKQGTLITGAIHGISTMLQHALGIESHPRSLEFPSRTIIFQFKGDLGFALISDQDSQVLRNGLENFSILFIQVYKDKLDKWNGSVSTFDGASDLIEQSFPFVDVQKDQTT